jgi:hypothetical protein
MLDSDTEPQSWEWIGKEYANGWNGVCLLVLGESSYGENPTAPNILVTAYTSDEPGHWHRTYTRFLQMLENCKANPSKERRKQIWDRLAFTNFLTQAAGLKHRDQPPEESWGKSLPAFLDFLAKLQPPPDGVIVWGYRLWYALHGKLGCRWGDSAVQCLQWNSEKKMGFIHWPNGKPIPAMAIGHPATPATKHEKWAPKLAAFLNAIHGEKGEEGFPPGRKG